uniref:Uncharacterized protein n=1 Tax=Anguilla anguilla TaxID=7936 RepID=A0A0E9Y157_ANGAN
MRKKVPTPTPSRPRVSPIPQNTVAAVFGSLLASDSQILVRGSRSPLCSTLQE